MGIYDFFTFPLLLCFLISILNRNYLVKREPNYVNSFEETLPVAATLRASVTRVDVDLDSGGSKDKCELFQEHQARVSCLRLLFF